MDLGWSDCSIRPDPHEQGRRVSSNKQRRFSWFEYWAVCVCGCVMCTHTWIAHACDSVQVGKTQGPSNVWQSQNCVLGDTPLQIVLFVFRCLGWKSHLCNVCSLALVLSEAHWYLQIWSADWTVHSSPWWSWPVSSLHLPAGPERRIFHLCHQCEFSGCVSCQRGAWYQWVWGCPTHWLQWTGSPEGGWACLFKKNFFWIKQGFEWVWMSCYLLCFVLKGMRWGWAEQPGQTAPLWPPAHSSTTASVASGSEQDSRQTLQLP